MPTLADSQYVLVEFSPDDEFKYIRSAVGQIASAGYIPILAHMERYEAIKKVAQVEQLRRDCNALVQMNNSSVVHKHGFFKDRWIRRLLAEGLVDFISSDAHDLPGRKNRMRAAFDRIKADYGREMAHDLAHGNAERLILDEAEL